MGKPDSMFVAAKTLQAQSCRAITEYLLGFFARAVI